MAKNNQGVILVLTLIIMSVLLATAISFAVFIISDVKQSKSIDDSISAYYGADAGIENSLFQFRKLSVTTTANLISGGRMASSTSIWNKSKSTDTEDVIIRQRLYNGQSIKLFFLGRVASTNLVKGISIFWQNGTNSNSNMQVTFTQLEPQQANDGQSFIYYTDQSKLERSDSISTGIASCYKFLNTLVNGGTGLFDYVVEIKALGAEGDYIENLKVQAYNTDNCQAGTSIKNAISNIAIVSEGQQGQSVQQITAQIPPKDPASGISSFVLFSEEDITKE